MSRTDPGAWTFEVLNDSLKDVTLHPALRVGGLTISYDQAAAWASAYFDASKNRTATDPYAYPAYDSYNVDQDAPDLITDADLLAPALLNVSISVRTFYGLQAIRATLQQALPPSRTPTLQDATVAEVRDLVKPVYELLDDAKARPSGVQPTTLSKIVHRKRPGFLVLHDKWVRTCYRNVPGAPVPPGKRSPSDYIVAISLAIRADIRERPETWVALRTIASHESSPPISLVRLLDAVAWRAGQEATRWLTTPGVGS